MREIAAWCVAVRAPAAIVRGVLAAVDAAAAANSEELLERAAASARSVLPRAALREDAGPIAPRTADATTTYENGLVRATLSSTGALLDCTAPSAGSIVALGNVVTLDRGWRGRAPGEPDGSAVRDGAFEVLLRLADARCALNVEVRAREPFVRCEAAVRGRGTLVVENCFTASEVLVECGGPNRERFAVVRAPDAALALLSLDGAQWKQRALRGEGTAVDQHVAEANGLATAAWAFVPVPDGESMGALEHLWQRYAHGPRVRLFRSIDDAVVVETCAPASEEGWVQVSVRECNGVAATMRVRSAGRMSEAVGAAIEAEDLVAPLAAFERRTLRVRF